MRSLPLLLLALPSFAQVAFDVKSDRVLVRINGTDFTALHFGKEARKPYLHPLKTASGKAVTRGFPVDPLPGEATDHPHQRGLWVGAERVNGVLDFWENEPTYTRPNMGVIDFKDLTGTENGDEYGTLSMVARWITKEGKELLTDRRRMVFYSKPADCRMFDVELDFEAIEKVVFEDHQDAVIGVRLALPFDDHYGGRLVNAEGAVNEPGVRGPRSPWVDWTATLNGEKVGVAIFDHPSNLNYPTRWHIRAMGIMFANPFARQSLDKDAPVLGHTLPPGRTLHLRYRVLVHPGSFDVAKAFKEFAESTGVRR